MKICTTLFLMMVSFTMYAQEYWSQVITTGDISARDNFGMLYDSANQRILLFGGRGENGFVNDLWQLDLETFHWSELVVMSAEEPVARHTPEVFSGPENNLWVVSGQSNEGVHNDVWTYDFNSGEWQEIFGDTIVSGVFQPRYGTASMFDPVNNNFVAFAGFAHFGRVKDTYSFQIDTVHWTNQGMPFRPERRCLHEGIFADDRREFWIFGGQFEGNRNDIWRLSVDSFVWNEFIPPIAPPARHFHSMIYRGNDQMIMFGGNSAPQGDYSGALNDLWKFDGDLVEWDTLPQGSNIPPSRVGHSAVYIPETDKIIVFGGQNESGFLNDLWVYDFDPVTVSVETPSTNELEVSIYPNPADEIFSLHFSRDPGVALVRVMDSSGKSVFESQLHASQYDVSALPAGIYFVQVVTESNNFVRKLLVN